MTTIASLLTKPLGDLAPRAKVQPFDAVVIGGGSAGITTARTLVEAGKTVALLEAGPLGLLTHVQDTDLRFDANLVRSVQAAFQYSPPLAPSGTFGSLIGCVGGRGLFWNGAVPRFSASDIEEWPLTMDQLADDYTWAEQQFNVTSAYGDTPLCERLCACLKASGLNARPGPYAVDCRPTADGWVGGMIGNSLSPLLRTALLTAPAGLLSLAVRSFVSRIVMANGRVSAVDVVDLDSGTGYQLACHTIVLAAGGFESVRLAQVSDVPDPNQMIGRYITDHSFVRAYYQDGGDPPTMAPSGRLPSAPAGRCGHGGHSPVRGPARGPQLQQPIWLQGRRRPDVVRLRCGQPGRRFHRVPAHG